MINTNGILQQNSTIFIENNRGFLYGDAVFETLKVVHNKILFLEDHYFRLMASMRIFRMEIPMNFTMEYFEEQVISVISALEVAPAYRIRFSVFRDSEGFYLPKTNDISFIVKGMPLADALYVPKNQQYEIELYKDAYITKQLFSTLKSNNKILQVAGSIFAHENNYDNCLVLNDEKSVVEALQGNVFLRFGSVLKTPPLSDGCLNGIMRKQVLEIVAKIENYSVEEVSISPFDIQKADEIFITNVITGLQSVSKYRKKEYTTELALEIIKRLNAIVRLN